MYRSREGSSAIISKLSQHKRVLIVGFEHLDRRNLLAFNGQDALANIGRTLDAAWQQGVAPGSKARWTEETVLGFKWRPHGGEPATEALKRNSVQVFLLCRDPLDRALSLLSKPTHEQFRIAKLKGEERERELGGLRNVSFDADPSLVAKTIDEYRAAQRDIVFRFIKPVIGFCPYPRLLKYEEFCENPTKFLNRILGIFDIERFGSEPDSQFVKTEAGNLADRCSNYYDIISSAETKAAIARWREHEDWVRRFVDP